MAHHPVIQEVEWLLVKGAIKPSTFGAYFYSNECHMNVSKG